MNEYKNKNWLEDQLNNKKRTMSDIARQFNKDITTIRYWIKKFNIKVNKKAKYPLRNFICPVCGIDFKKRIVKKCQVVYCSKKCAYKGRTLGLTKRTVKNGYKTTPIYIELQCKFCGNDFVVEKTNKNRKYCSRECFLRMHSKVMKGKNNPSWVNGSSYRKRSYRGEDWDKQKIKCYKRDNYTCQLCHTKCIGKKDFDGNNGKQIIQCHHINGYIDERSNELDNLITLCASCHKKVHEGVLKIDMD